MLRMIRLEMDQIEEIQRELNGGAINLSDIENRHKIKISICIYYLEGGILVKIGTLLIELISDLTRRTESLRS